MWVCRRCVAENDDIALFCEACGARRRRNVAAQLVAAVVAAAVILAYVGSRVG